MLLHSLCNFYSYINDVIYCMIIRLLLSSRHILKADASLISPYCTIGKHHQLIEFSGVGLQKNTQQKLHYLAKYYRSIDYESLSTKNTIIWQSFLEVDPERHSTELFSSHYLNYFLFIRASFLSCLRYLILLLTLCSLKLGSQSAPSSKRGNRS